MTTCSASTGSYMESLLSISDIHFTIVCGLTFENHIWRPSIYLKLFFPADTGPNYWRTTHTHTHIRTSKLGWKLHSQSSTNSFNLTCTHHFLLLSCPWYKLLAPYYNLWTNNKAQPQEENNCCNINNNNNNTQCAILSCSCLWYILIYTGYVHSFIPVSTSTITT